MDTEIIKLYHCNEEKKINCFIEEDELIFSEHVQDDNWAGQGMYFWDNVGNALYWKKQKMSHVSPDENVLIAERMLFLYRMLNYICNRLKKKFLLQNICIFKKKITSAI